MASVRVEKDKLELFNAIKGGFATGDTFNKDAGKLG